MAVILIFNANMPQEFHVLRCFNCETFQVDIVKKVPKWNCKVCGEKQSLQKIYGKGPAKECRVLVQSLNLQRSMKPNFGSHLSQVSAFCHKQEKKWSEFTADDQEQVEPNKNNNIFVESVKCTGEQHSPLSSKKEGSKWTELIHGELQSIQKQVSCDTNSDSNERQLSPVSTFRDKTEFKCSQSQLGHIRFENQFKSTEDCKIFEEKNCNFDSLFDL